jgi:hypothetical protein
MELECFSLLPILSNFLVFFLLSKFLELALDSSLSLCILELSSSSSYFSVIGSYTYLYSYTLMLYAAELELLESYR